MVFSCNLKQRHLFELYLYLLVPSQIVDSVSALWSTIGTKNNLITTMPFYKRKYIFHRRVKNPPNLKQNDMLDGYLVKRKLKLFNELIVPKKKTIETKLF